ncbi:MAG: DUF4349 domain-containing protein [Acidobacteria bacterium]|nr:DUF4349 domain-containing protein [Acidobacteriota bacterium]MBK8812235.1 DUF4349 domain-containing protein [Acidobacteriota bacterium]
MKTFKLIAILILVSFVLSACGEASAPMSKRSEQDSVTRSSEAMPNAADGAQKQTAPVTQQVSLDQTQNSQAPTTERKIVRNGDLQLESDAPEEVQQKITAIAEAKGGFVVESQQSSSDVRANRRDTVTMTVRVPAAKFSEALDEIRKSANRVIVETVKSDDVTEEFIDVEARLKAKKSLEAQFLEIMKRANTVEDALNVQSKLSDVRAEIEKIEGRLRFLQNQTSLSTIKVRVQTPAAFSSNSKGFFYQFGESVGKGFDVAIGFVLGFVTFIIAILPFLILVVLPIYLLIRYLVRKARRKETVSEIVREELGKQ